MIQKILQYKYWIIGALVGGFVFYKYNAAQVEARRNAAIAAQQQNDATMVTAAPFTVASMPVGDLGGGGNPMEGIAPMAIGSLSAGGESSFSATGYSEQPETSMYSYMLDMMKSQNTSDLNLAQNASVTWLASTISKVGGAIGLTSDSKGTTTLKIDVNQSAYEKNASAFVTGLYQNYEGRESGDAGGVAYWTNQLTSGASFDDVAKGFKSGSAIYQANNPQPVLTPQVSQPIATSVSTYQNTSAGQTNTTLNNINSVSTGVINNSQTNNVNFTGSPISNGSTYQVSVPVAPVTKFISKYDSQNVSYQ